MIAFVVISLELAISLIINVFKLVHFILYKLLLGMEWNKGCSLQVHSFEHLLGALLHTIIDIMIVVVLIIVLLITTLIAPLLLMLLIIVVLLVPLLLLPIIIRAILVLLVLLLILVLLLL